MLCSTNRPWVSLWIIFSNHNIIKSQTLFSCRGSDELAGGERRRSSGVPGQGRNSADLKKSFQRHRRGERLVQTSSSYHRSGNFYYLVLTNSYVSPCLDDPSLKLLVSLLVTPHSFSSYTWTITLSYPDNPFHVNNFIWPVSYKSSEFIYLCIVKSRFGSLLMIYLSFKLFTSLIDKYNWKLFAPFKATDFQQVQTCNTSQTSNTKKYGTIN